MADDDDKSPSKATADTGRETANADNAKSGGLAGLMRAITRTLTRSFAKGTIAGTFSGIVETSTMYPLDTVITKMKLSNEPTSIGAVLKSHFNGQSGLLGGMRSLFQGFGTPLVGQVMTNSVLFLVYESVLGNATERKYSATVSSFAAGFVAGFMFSVIKSPFDLLSTRMQAIGNKEVLATTLSHSGIPHLAYPPSSGSMFWHVLKNYGIRGFYRGFSASLVADSFGYGVFFAVYENIKRDDSMLSILLAGGTAGALSTGFVYPFAVLKTHMQASFDKTPPTLLSSVRMLYSTYGPRVFSRGLFVSMIHSFPATAIGFLSYEMALNVLAN